MHVEDIAAGAAPGPYGTAQRVPTDDGAEPDDEGVGQAGLDRRERHPARPEAQDAVRVDLRDGSQVGPSPGQEPVHPGLEVGLRGGEADPVLQAVEGFGRGDAVVDEQQPGDVPLSQPGALFGLAGPPHQHHVHDSKR